MVHESEKRAFLTPAMRRVLLIVAGVVLLGLFVALWLTLRPSAQGIDDVAATPFSASPTQGPVPGATPTTGSEVLPPTDTDEIKLPSLAPPAPLVPGPLPAAGSIDNGLVDGFPIDIMGPMPDSDVVNSSIAVEDQTMQVTLTARTDASPDVVEAYYASAWTALGLLGQATGANEGLAYVGPYESLTLAFSPATGTGTIYAIYGVFRTS